MAPVPIVRRGVNAASLWVLLTACPTALQAEGVDTCNAILSDALLTKRIGTNDRSYQAAEHYWACSANSSEIQRHFQMSKTQQTGASGGDGYAGVTIQGSHSTLGADHNSTDEIDAWKRLNCSRTDRQQNETAAGFLSEQYLGPGVAEDWAKCIASRDGLQCTGRRQRAGISLIVSYHSYEVALPVITEFTVRRGRTLENITHDATVLIGTQTSFIRRDPSTDTIITLNAVRGGRTAISCQVFLPKDQPPPTPPPPAKPSQVQ
ncbi:hypothetical protein [Bradyrhizobium cenepequi]|uniref:hypothetical protein n=1 Tax=Bradyrhizobium cenepequi TaxID=2821403 RepID=UPI001CE262B9|nr:hypothetical protein [Bradyrhizobium cenepequi]MCA6111310.1 hypothetical protein [Bradyrhizobium cenepequi]